MKITDYASLQEVSLQWISRDDDPNDDVRRNITTMIQLAEVKLRPRLKGIRILKTRAKALLDEEWEWLPTDFAALSTVSIIPGNDEAQERPLAYKTEQQFVVDNARLRLAGSPIAIYTIIGKQIRFGPFPSTPPADSTMFRMIYFARPPALSDDAPVNDFLVDHPEIYLYATLVETAPYINDDARIQTWRAALDDALEQAGENEAARGTMAASPGGWRP